MDYEQSPFIHGHDEKCAEITCSIKTALTEAFRLCDLEMECYKATAREFSDLGKGGAGGGTGGEESTNIPPPQSKVVDVETDVDSLKSKLASLTEQQTLAKNIKDQQNMSIFRADFKPLKRTILPNISKTIIQMQGILIYRVYYLLRSLNFFYENQVDYQLNQKFFNFTLFLS